MKKYIKPTMEVAQMKPVCMDTTSLPKIDSGSSEPVDGEQALSHRGIWEDGVEE